MTQLPLFSATADALAAAHAEAARIAARLPADVRFGTSSWSFPGWAGLVYTERRSQAALARDGLREYARHPLLRTVGIDRSYYGPVPETDLERYADQLPAGFPCCLKAPAVVTSVVVPDGRRGGPARPNPDFLSAERFTDEQLEPCARAFFDHSGPFIVECPPVPRAFRPEPAAFVERLDGFLERLPDSFQYAVEIRDRALLTPAYAAALARHGAGHVYNYWRAMPLPPTQADTVAPETLPFVMIRLLMPPGTSYESLKGGYQPFDRTVRPDPEMRRDVAQLIERAVQARQPAYVLVNNKAEGSAPRTVVQIARDLAADLQPRAYSPEPTAIP